MRPKKTASPAPTLAAADLEFLTLHEAAARLRLSVKTLRRRIRAGLIRVTPEGGRQLIALDDFYAYVEHLRRGRKRLRERQKTRSRVVDRAGQVRPGVSQVRPSLPRCETGGA
jgi:excisionase family DNA binding protein